MDYRDDEGRLILFHPHEGESRREAAEALVELAIAVTTGSIDKVDCHWRPERAR